MRWTIVALSTPGSSKVANTVETPTANEIGMPSAISTMKARAEDDEDHGSVHARAGDRGGLGPHDLVDDELEGEHHDEKAARPASPGSTSSS